MKEPELNFKPSKKFESLLPNNEKILYSLKLTECTKQLIGYKLSLLIYEGHISNERFYLNAEKFPKWAKFTMNVFMSLIDVPVGAEYQERLDMAMAEKKNSELYGKIIAIPKSYIGEFEVVKNLGIPLFTRIRFNEDGKKNMQSDEFVFCPYPSKEVSSLPEFKKIDFSNAYLGEQFANIGTKWLKEK